MADMRQTPLHALHLELGARMVPFAGYDMPVQYPMGVLREHQHCRAQAGLFDVSHMGQLRVSASTYAAAALALESLLPVDVLDLPKGRQRYGFLTNDAGGIRDDLMLANRGDHVFVVVNAACKAADLAHLQAHLPADVTVADITDRALLALQGPAAEDVLAGLNNAVRDMAFMDVTDGVLNGVTCWISRSGYTGEDGFEISVPNASAEALARALLADDRVAPIGLGARDSLRLEAGLCLYGQDIDAGTTPAEAGLIWAVQKVRRAGGARAGGFPGAQAALATPARRRVGLIPEGRAPMRDGVPLFDAADAATPVGTITSGGFGPTIGGPMAMGYVGTAHATAGTLLYGELRGKRMPVKVATLPFTPARFKR